MAAKKVAKNQALAAMMKVDKVSFIASDTRQTDAIADTQPDATNQPNATDETSPSDATDEPSQDEAVVAVQSAEAVFVNELRDRAKLTIASPVRYRQSVTSDAVHIFQLKQTEIKLGKVVPVAIHKRTDRLVKKSHLEKWYDCQIEVDTAVEDTDVICYEGTATLKSIQVFDKTAKVKSDLTKYVTDVWNCVQFVSVRSTTCERVKLATNVQIDTAKLSFAGMSKIVKAANGKKSGFWSSASKSDVYSAIRSDVTELTAEAFACKYTDTKDGVKSLPVSDKYAALLNLIKASGSKAFQKLVANDSRFKSDF